MTSRYVNKDGGTISADRWRELSKDATYCVLHEYSNEDYYAVAKWHGVIDVNASKDYQTPFAFEAKTFVNDKWVDDPFSSKKCKTAQEAVKLYEEFLANYTDCKIKKDISGNEKFYEVANKLAPPPPPDPDIPHISEKTKDYTGSW